MTNRFSETSERRETAQRWSIAVGVAAACLATAGAFAGVAASQTPEVQGETSGSKLVTVLTLGLPCGAEMSTAEAMRARGVEAQVGTTELRAALDRISADDSMCEPIRNAASSLMVSLAVAAAGEVEDDNQAELVASATLVAEALGEADRRAREKGFEVGPPPRNLTRTRVSGR